MMMPPPPFSPSDLDALPPKSNGTTGKDTPLRVAGRVLACDGLSLVLTDAFTEVDVELDVATDLEHGDLAIVVGKVREGRIVEATVEHRIAPVSPPRLDEDSEEHDLTMEGRAARSETHRLVGQRVGQALVARSVAMSAIREFFGKRRFLEVDTPVVVPSPGLDLHLEAFEVVGGLANAEAYLGTSPEYAMKRLLVGGVPRCFQLAHAFRRGEVGPRHNPEFTILEWYRAFATMEHVLEDTEQLVRFVATEMLGETKIHVGDTVVDLAEPFERLTVGDAFERYAGVPAKEAIALADQDEERFFRLLIDEVEPRLETVTHAVFLTDYPASQASLARLRPADPTVCERFELYVGGIELCNGFGELTDPREQRVRLLRDQETRSAAGKAVYPVDERFLAALEEGMPPSAGNALGVDRLVALCVGTDRVAAVQAFPVGWL